MPQSIEMTRQQLYDLVWSRSMGDAAASIPMGACHPEKALREASGASAAAGALEKVFPEASGGQGTASADHGRAAHLG
jgi:hypothetical protein